MAIFPSLALGLALGAWLVFATIVVRRAELAVACVSPPAPRATLAAAALLIVFANFVRPWHEALIGGCACVALIAASGPDYRTGYIFDALTLPTAILVGVLALTFGFGAEAAAGVALLVGAFGTVVIASRGRLMGLGDVKAMFSIGAAFGPLESTLAIFAACASGIVVALVTKRFARGVEIGFGPHLALGSALAFVVGDPIVRAIVGT